MQTSVKLQDPFSYSIYPVLIILVLLVLLTVYIIIKYRRKNKIPKNIEETKIKEIDEKDINKIKEKYLKKLETVEEKLNSNKISVRHAYQMLSAIIRYFVFEVTNIKVQNYTLREIEKLKMPALTELIEEYYAPEFAEYSLGNIKASIEKTRKVIEKWN